MLNLPLTAVVKPDFMKKMITLLLSGTFSLCVQPRLMAQSVPDGDFETWTTATGVETLVSGWSLSDEAGLGCVPYSSVKTTDKATGSYALLLETNNCTNFGGIHEGWAQLNFTTTAKPDSVRFNYKAIRSGTDSAMIDIWVNNHSTPVGHAQYYISGSQSSYKEVSVPFKYFFSLSTTDIDIFITSDAGWNRSIGNRLQVDDIRFVNQPTGTGNSYNKSLRLLSCSPVPASALLNVSVNLDADAAITTTLRNMEGQVMWTGASHQPAGNSTIPVNIVSIPNGIYLCEVQVAGGERAIERIIKQ